MDNIFSAPPPGTTLQTITEEWKVISGFHALLRQRLKLEVEHLLQLRQLQDNIDPTWSKSGPWALISPIIELWKSQTEIIKESSERLAGLFDACPIEPSPDEPEEEIPLSSKYALLLDTYETYQDCQKVASSTEAVAEIRKLIDRNRYNNGFLEGALPITERNYRNSVAAQRNALQPIAELHSKVIPEKLERHVKHAEYTQAYLRDYLIESSKFAFDFVKPISMAQKNLSEFSSLALIDPSHKCLEKELSHPSLQPAVYINHCLGRVPAEPVLGVFSCIPKMLELGGGRDGFDPHRFDWLNVGCILRAEERGTCFDEVFQKLKESFHWTPWDISRIALEAIGPLLPVGDSAIRRYKNGIKRDEITLLLKPFPIENRRMAHTIMVTLYSRFNNFHDPARWILGSSNAGQLLEDIWRKWDFENHCPLPREVVRTQPNSNSNGKPVFKKTGLPYKPPQ